ncbi:M81 family metallopeptidase [Virgibacillus dakarensis]|uniref:M81 family metallopeptidase n=1 Tax=Virgibacillus dakarensis TaxID=1917889 RepID=UPI000B442800|nr:M81 family metallopeptidase [Virgibacillus dakarensis]
MRVLVGGLIQESNTFSPNRSDKQNFLNHCFLIGEQMLNIGVENELSGFYSIANEKGVKIIPTLFGSAVSSGVFLKQDFLELKELLLSKIKQEKDYDGVYIALHGAMVSEDYDDVEGELLESIRKCIGKDIPLVISLDLHANVTKKMIDNVNGVIGFKTYPHIDFFETGYRSGRYLFSLIENGNHSILSLSKIPMIVPAENSQTTNGPFAELWAEAKQGELNGDSLLTSLFPVQPWLDINEMGFGVVVVSNDKFKAERESQRLAQLVWKKRHEFNVKLHSVSEIANMALDSTDNIPYIISDSADSPGAGSTGDSNVVLKILLDLKMDEKLNCLLTIVDKPAVEKILLSGIGATIQLDIGYSINSKQGDSIKVDGKVIRLGDGKFQLKGGYAKNTIASMGRCGVFQIGKISLLITEKPTFSGDPSMYRSMGLEPSDADLVLVKSANQFRADYENISSRIFILDTPGCSPANLNRLSYKKISRPFYPFDDNFNWVEKHIGHTYRK